MEIKKNFVFHTFSTVFGDRLFIFLAASIAANLLALFYFFLYQVTTLAVFFSSNTAFYVWFYIISTVLISFLFGTAISLMIWQWREQKKLSSSGLSGNVFGSFLGALSAGCPVCGAFLFTLLGLGGGLTIFPFQGLEIKVVSLGFLLFANFSLARSIYQKSCSGCDPADLEPRDTFFKIEDKKAVFVLNRQTLMSSAPILIGFLIVILVFALPIAKQKFNFGFTFQKKNIVAGTASNNQAGAGEIDSSGVLKQINPIEGYTVPAVFGDIGPKLLAAGAIDFQKMKKLYQDAGSPLSQEQIKILTEGSNEKIKITPENSYFLLNFLWALGIANKNQILDEGPIAQYGKDKIGNFASTGGWDQGKIGNVKSTEFFSKYEIIKLTPDQQKVLEDFAYNSYRPCCSNPTAFPDCNHGAAALALGEIMASQGASVEEIFEAFKYVNSFWFPQTYFDIATYFQAKDGKDWSEVDGRTVAGKDYSTPQGWQRTRQWLSANGYLEEAPSSGGGCGA